MTVSLARIFRIFRIRIFQVHYVLLQYEELAVGRLQAATYKELSRPQLQIARGHQRVVRASEMHEVTQQDVSTWSLRTASPTTTEPCRGNFTVRLKKNMPRAKLQARVQKMRDLSAPARMQVRGQLGEDSYLY